MSSDTFTPRWASAPADTLVRWLDARSVTGDDLPELIGRSRAWCSAFLSGSVPVDAATAAALGALTDTPATFWVNRETSYREDRNRVEADSWAQGLPMSEMARLGWLPATNNWKEQLELAFSFFGVASVAEWRVRYEALISTAKFRTRRDPTLSGVAICAWMRQCERSAPTTDAPFDLTSFATALTQVRRLTRWADPIRFLPELGRILATTGVRLALVPALPGSGISGATWRDIQGSPIIGLTARHLVDDQFWFSFFHEAAHVTLHQGTGPFIDTFEDRPIEASESVDPIEQGADTLAIGLMLERPHTLLSVRASANLRDIARIAAANGTSVGVIVGQLQHLGVLTYAQRNTWKRRYRWNGLTLEMK